jgi:glutaconate CoA-transferase subunit A
VDHVVFCFNSLELFGPAPKFRAAVESGRVTHEEFTALELHHALLAAEMNLASLPLQAPVGSWRAPAENGPLTTSPAIDIDIVLLHAQRADRNGNLEIGGAEGLDRTLALAGRRVLATVEEIVEAGAFRDRAAIVPRQFVEAVAIAQGGAWPTSCLPIYATDYGEIARRVELQQFSNSTAHAGPSELAYRAARVDWRNAQWPSPGVGEGPADIVVAWLSRRLDDTSVCSVGSASSLASVGYLVAKSSHAPGLTLVTHNGGYIDAPARFASLTFGEAADFATAAGVCGGDDSYRWFYQQSRVTDEVVGAAQIDAQGRTNNSWVTRVDGTRVRLPGQGGMADVANMHRNFVLYAPRQSRRQLVDQVEWLSASRGVSGELERASLGYGPGEVCLVTDLAVFHLDPANQRFILASVHPGVTLDAVRSATGFEFAVAPTVAVTPALTRAESEAILRVDPFGLRTLEFVAARDRLGAIRDVLGSEQEYLEGLSA